MPDGQSSSTEKIAASWPAALALLATYLLAMFIALRAPILSGLDLGFGDRGDAIIEISLLEHWRNVFTATGAHWRQTLYFHPYPGTLGYNDGYLLFGIVYSFWRQWFDPFLSDTLNIATWKTVGFFASYALVARVLRWERPIALLVALLFTIANGMIVQAVHAQLQIIALLPVVASLAILLLRAELAGDRRKAAALAIAIAGLFGLWLMTGFYLAWFTFYFIMIGCIFWFCALGRGRVAVLRQVIRDHARTGLIFGAAFLIAIVPFLIVYLPKLRETGGHDFCRTYFYLPTVVDPFNVGGQNYFYGWIIEGIKAANHRWAVTQGAVASDEGNIAQHETGFPLILLILILAGAWKLLRHRPEPSKRAAYVFALAVMVSWLLTLKLGPFSPWLAIYILVPGAKGLRVVLRYQLWLILPLLLMVAAAWRAQFMGLLRSRPVLAVAVAALLVAEQLTGASSAALSRSRQIGDFSRIAPMPAECPAFYVVDARPRGGTPQPGGGDGRLYPHNVDAMLLASLWRKPTINGFSTFNPPDWDFANPDAPDYDARVARYARAHGLSVLCRLDAREAVQWRVMRYSR